MLLFADTSLDNWLLKDEPTVSSSRSHNKNDAIFVPGLWPRPKPLHNYSQDKLTLRTLDNTSSVTISQDGEIRLSAATILKLNAPIIEINGVQMETMNPGYPATFIFVPPGVPDEAEEVSRP